MPVFVTSPHLFTENPAPPEATLCSVELSSTKPSALNIHITLFLGLKGILY